MKRQIFYILGFLALLSFAYEAKAADQFEFDYVTTYIAQEDASTKVNHQVTITNRQNDIVPTNYSLNLGFKDISEIEAKDTKNKLKTEIQETAEGKLLKVILANQGIGEDKQTFIDISFTAKDYLDKKGLIWVFGTPPIASLDNANSYKIILEVPKSFGPLIYISPSPESRTENSKTLKYEFNKENLYNKALSAAFGNQQIIDFNLKYSLKNSSVFNTMYEIALPPDVENRQQVVLKEITPSPDKIVSDKDGNVLAQYKLKGLSDLKIEVKGEARTFLKQLSEVAGNTKSQKPIPSNFMNYTKPEKFWEVNDKKIKEIADKNTQTENSIIKNAQQIYKYVMAAPSNDESNPVNTKRLGALGAFNKPQNWSSLEFTDTFITLARTAGIPSRQLDGYILSSSTEKDFLHAWPEFYDPEEGWIQIDPTWGKLTGQDYFRQVDPNRLILSVRGLNSEWPVPAGSYKFDSEEKQITASFAENENIENTKPQVKISERFGLNIFKIIQGFKPVTITNKSGFILHNFGDSKVDVMPFQSTEVYIKNPSKPYFFDANGIKRDIEL